MHQWYALYLDSVQLEIIIRNYSNKNHPK